MKLNISYNLPDGDYLAVLSSIAQPAWYKMRLFFAIVQPQFDGFVLQSGIRYQACGNFVLRPDYRESAIDNLPSLLLSWLEGDEVAHLDVGQAEWHAILSVLDACIGRLGVLSLDHFRSNNYTSPLVIISKIRPCTAAGQEMALNMCRQREIEAVLQDQFQADLRKELQPINMQVPMAPEGSTQYRPPPIGHNPMTATNVTPASILVHDHPTVTMQESPANQYIPLPAYATRHRRRHRSFSLPPRELYYLSPDNKTGFVLNAKTLKARMVEAQYGEKVDKLLPEKWGSI